MEFVSTAWSMDQDYPMEKERELTEEEKTSIKRRIRELDDEEMDLPISYRVADEFECSPSQVAGIYAMMNR